MELIIATHNINKIKEFKELLKDTNYTVKGLNDLNFTAEIVEDGKTFKENSLIKARYISKIFNTIVIADDSGLEVKALNNQPGIYSARYSGKGDYENNLKLLSNLLDIKNRKARFSCVISIVYPSGKEKNFKGIFKGYIAHQIDGTNGFGYDPIFIPKKETKTLASLSNEYKSLNSHRAKAFRKLIKYFSR